MAGRRAEPSSCLSSARTLELKAFGSAIMLPATAAFDAMVFPLQVRLGNSVTQDGAEYGVSMQFQF